MAPSDDSDPFGSGERTVIRPNPGGRAPQQPGGGAAPGQAPFGAPPPAGGGFGAPPGGGAPFGGQPQGGAFGGQPAAGPFGGGQQGATPFGNQQQGQQAAMSGPSEVIRAPGKNPLINAATPLLDLLGRLRTSMTSAPMHNLQVSVIREIESFDANAAAFNGNPAQFEVARYILCVFADDVIQNLPDCAAWAANSMEARYFTYRVGGEQFYVLLDTQLRNPGDNYEVLELMYVALSLGFEGKHRASQNGMAAIAHLRSQIHGALRAVRERKGWMISPHWKGEDLARKSIGMQIPFWAVAALVALLLAGGYFTLRYMLTEQTTALRTDIGRLHAHGAIYVQNAIKPPTNRPVVVNAKKPPPPPPPPPPPETAWKGQLKRIREALSAEISAGDVSANNLNPNFIIVRFSSKEMFAPGSADLTPKFRRIARRLGETFTQEFKLLSDNGLKHGMVIAVGHSDAQKLSSRSRWRSNYHLSKERAKSVMNAITAYAPNELRTQIEGRGPDDPVCRPITDRNKCWDLNRRVDVLIQRTK